MSRVAVVGGGLFGCTAAIELAGAGHDVVLFERNQTLLRGASAQTQGRVHTGFHYPRSVQTAEAVRDARASFVTRFYPAIDRTSAHHYVVARDSKVAGSDYLAFCDKLGLSYDVVPHHRLVRTDTVDTIVRAHDEAFIDVHKLRNILNLDLRYARVRVVLGWTSPPTDILGQFDVLVDATYGSARSDVYYELTEVALVKLGEHYRGRSFVVVDGPFTSLDPVPGSDFHALYHVDHSVHVTMCDDPTPPVRYAHLVNRRAIGTPVTHVEKMLQGAREFLLALGMPEYHGSMFTVRPVLRGTDDTDERPTLVDRRGNIVRVLSGKMVTAVDAARRVVELVAQ